MDTATVAIILQVGATGALAAGYKKIWMFTNVHNDLMGSKDREIAAQREIIAEKNRSIEFQASQYGERLHEKEEECERERDRAELFIDRTLHLLDQNRELSKITGAAVLRVAESQDVKKE
jgi:hypothetical protein